jgi:hypothetical protein
MPPVPRSSETVAALASALAKAQAELINPEKSLTATIRTGRPGDERPRHRPQDAGPARDCHLTDDRHRPDRRHGQFDHHARPCLGRVDCFGLAGLSHRRDRQSPAHGRRADLRSPLCPLTAADAKLVEDAFERRLSELPSSEAAAPSNDEFSVAQIAGPKVIATRDSTDAGQAKGIDKSILTVAAPRRYRNREHLRYVAQQACLVCGRKPSDPHHLGFTQPRALGRKVSDEFAVPLCRGHYRAVHRSGDERAWWQQAGIDPIKVARRLWKATRGMGQRRSPRVALPRHHAAAATSDPSPKNEEISAPATTQEGTRLPDLPG